MKSSLRLASLLILAVGVTLHAQTPAGFVENRGQWPDEVRFRLQLDGLTMWVTDRGAVYDLYERVEPLFVMLSFDQRDAMAGSALSMRDEPSRVCGHVLRAEFVGISENVEAIGGDKLSGYVNYVVGDDESRWGRNCRIYSSVRLNDVYDGIDLLYYIDQGLPRFDVIVAPGVDLSILRMSLDGAIGVHRSSAGRLVIGTSVGDLEMRDLLVYQTNEKGERCQVPSAFRLTDEGDIVLDLGPYRRDRELIVDPLIYSTLIGSPTQDHLGVMDVDDAGNVYLAGWTHTNDYPTTPGAYDTTHDNQIDVFITKLDASGSTLIYSTFLGSGHYDRCSGIHVDSLGDAYITGSVERSGLGKNEFPTTAGVFDTTHAGRSKSFVAKLNGDGSDLIFSTLVGGEGNTYESTVDIEVDDEGFIYLAGRAFYQDGVTKYYPTTEGAYSRVHRGHSDIFVTKMDPQGTSLIYSTFIGSAQADYVHDLAIDSDGNAYVAGSSGLIERDSAFYPTTPGAFDVTYEDELDAVLTKLNADGSALAYSTFIGSNGDDIAIGVDVNDRGEAYITGSTATGGVPFPTTANAFRTTSIGDVDAFAMKFDADGSSLLFSTLLGSTGDDVAYDIAVDRNGDVYLIGYTEFTDLIFSDVMGLFPTTLDAYDTLHGGSTDLFLTKMNAQGSLLLYSTVIGGSGHEIGIDLAIDGIGGVYVAGEVYPIRSEPVDFPTTPGAFQPTHAGDTDAFIIKFGLAVSMIEWSHRFHSNRLDLE